MLKFLLASGVILLVLSGWVLVQHLSRDFARRHPEFGPPRDDRPGCGGGCVCGSNRGTCDKD